MTDNGELNTNYRVGDNGCIQDIGDKETVVSSGVLPICHWKRKYSKVLANYIVIHYSCSLTVSIDDLKIQT